ncbi:hypothetical protein AK812_SmicGene36851 [Symbiodinium microadriaticum]|uniref:Uncharacterized protein n=1 Tax=Symbiodinium microadriaticum TaxID=2951 RepID=A0A1Q9CHT1_SYMMI|nr:hypothetical protein AK812_SmicGene36851 [Symbiodinium microadriaticum]
MPPKSPQTPQKDSWADATEQEAASETASSSKPQPAQDLSSADPARVYRPQLDIDAFRSLDQPGAFTQRYLFDISLLDRRAQPLYGHPHYKPIECMVFDKRPWICFYGGSPPTVVAETDDWWYTMYDREGGCCLQGWPMFLLQDFMRLFADPPPSPEPTTQADDAASSLPGDFVRERFLLPANYRPSFGRFWHLGCKGQEGEKAAEVLDAPQVQSEDRIITAVQLYTWALVMALMLASFFCGADLRSGREEANFEADCTARKNGSTHRESKAGLQERLEGWHFGVPAEPREGFEDHGVHEILYQEAAQELIDDFKTNYPGPTTQELLAADRKIWGTIGTLVSAGWSLDEALYEEEGGLPEKVGILAADTGLISKLPLRLGHITEISYTSLLKTSGPFVAHRPPICDGAGAPSSADHSLPHASGISKASKAWIQWAQKSNLSHRVYAHISQSRPEHPLSQEEQSETLAILCSALNLDQASMATVSPGQPFRLQLMQALAKLIEDPDQDLPSILADGVHTGVFSEIKPSGLWPPAKLQPLSQSGLEVCQGNWRPAEEDPETVAALLADEEAAGSDYAYGPRSSQIISATSLLLFAFNGTLWRYVVCHFGAKFSAYWWQRVGAPISWKKAYVGDSLIWCGWKFNFAYETVELCAAKSYMDKNLRPVLPGHQNDSGSTIKPSLVSVSHVAGAHNEWADDLSRDVGLGLGQSLLVLQGQSTARGGGVLHAPTLTVLLWEVGCLSVRSENTACHLDAKVLSIDFLRVLLLIVKSVLSFWLRVPFVRRYRLRAAFEQLTSSLPTSNQPQALPAVEIQFRRRTATFYTGASVLVTAG